MHRDDDGEIIEALIERCQLSPGAVADIYQAMQAMQLRFPDAAVHLGLVQPTEVEEVLAEVQKRHARRSSSIVERLMQRRSGLPSVTVRHSQMVVPGPQIILLHDPDCDRSERLRALRTQLLLLGEQSSRANLIALLSPCAGEGRSQLSAELAVAFSQLGRRTLLVDGDLRKPRQHLLFGAPNDWGLAQTLAVGEPPALYGVEGLPFLSLLTAGAPASNPLELLSGGRLGPLVSNWRYNYDFVVIDTPPVDPYADGLAVATMAGRVLVLSRLGFTAHKQMKGMLRRLAMTQSRILGAVINRF